jgi:hypothetical protein
MQSTRYLCEILMKLEFSRQVFEECSDIKFHENLSRGSRVIACGRTDEANSSDRQCAADSLHVVTVQNTGRTTAFEI